MYCYYYYDYDDDDDDVIRRINYFYSYTIMVPFIKCSIDVDKAIEAARKVLDDETINWGAASNGAERGRGYYL